MSDSAQIHLNLKPQNIAQLFWWFLFVLRIKISSSSLILIACSSSHILISTKAQLSPNMADFECTGVSQSISRGKKERRKKVPKKTKIRNIQQRNQVWGFAVRQLLPSECQQWWPKYAQNWQFLRCSYSDLQPPSVPHRPLIHGNWTNFFLIQRRDNVLYIWK